MMPHWQFVADERGVTGLKRRKCAHESIPQSWESRAVYWRALAASELRAYLAGRLQSFSVPYNIRTLPPFHRAVLHLTAKIPYGETRTYGWLARRLGRPGAARAAGNALARNPLPIIIPCHRVVRADGAMGAFVLGPGWKKRLLDLEKVSQKQKLLNERHLRSRPVPYPL